MSLNIAALLLFFLLRDTTPFRDISAWAGLATDAAPRSSSYLAAGGAFADFDGDGWVDLFVPGPPSHRALMLNRGDGAFVRSSHSDSLGDFFAASGGGSFADYDNDGWQDLYLYNRGANRLWRNRRGAGFEDVTARAGVGDIGWGAGAAWGDYDGDGWLDLYVTNGACQPDCDGRDFSRNRDALFRNRGDGGFTDVSGLLAYEALLGAGAAAAWLDFDDDRDLDLYVVNDAAVNPIGNRLWRNDGAGCGGWCFRDVSAAAGADIVSRGTDLAAGDYDNDGDIDLYVTNRQSPMTLLRNGGDGAFRDVAAAAGVDHGGAQGWGAAFFDYDNDGWLDLFLAASSPGGGDADALFRNRGDGSFGAVDAVAGARYRQSDFAARGVSIADIKRDGRLDFALTGAEGGLRLFQNVDADSARHNWMAIALEGGGLGTRVRVETVDGRRQIRELRSGAGHEPILHFGLSDSQVRRVVVMWLNGDLHEYTRVPVNRRCRVTREGMDCAPPPGGSARTGSRRDE